MADYLSRQGVPFSVAVYPRYRDPNGVNSTSSRNRDYTLADRPNVVSALKYMQARSGTLLTHGYTHQYGNVANPYDAVSANDFEFYRAHVDANVPASRCRATPIRHHRRAGHSPPRSGPTRAISASASRPTI